MDMQDKQKPKSKDYDTMWSVRMGVIKITLVPSSQEEAKKLSGYLKRKGSHRIADDMVMVIHIYDHIFGKNIYCAMGDRDRCQWALCQLTDRDDIDLHSENSGNSGIAFAVGPDKLGLWVKHPWKELRSSQKISLLSHEALHVCENVMEIAGMKPHRENEELRAYYQEWIQECVSALINEDVDAWGEMLIKVDMIYEKA